MALYNCTWIPDAQESSVDGSSDTDTRLGPVYFGFVKSLEMFPTRLTSYIYSIIAACGIPANTILLLYVISYKRYKTPVFCIILSLGVADLGVCVGALLFYTLIFPFVLSPLWLCQLATAVLNLSYLSSSYHIAVFAILRFIQLVYPLASHTKVTTLLLFKVCVAIWGVHSIQAIIIAAYYKSLEVIPDVFICFFVGDLHLFIVIVLLFYIAAPFIVTSGFHAAKQVIVVVSRSALVTSQDDKAKAGRRQTDSRALAIVIVVYLVTAFPYSVEALRVYVLKVTAQPIDLYLVEVFKLLAYSNNAINPWIYLFAAGSVRADIRKMLRCRKSWVINERGNDK